MTQTIIAPAPDTEAAVSLKLFGINNDSTVIASANKVAPVAGDLYPSFLFSGLALADYVAVIYTGSDASIQYLVSVTATDGTFYVASLVPAGSGAQISGLVSSVAALETKVQADARQSALIQEHNQTQTDVSNISVSGGSTAISGNDITAIVAGITKVTPRIRDASAGCYSMIAGDTWTQAISLTAPSADKYAVSIKCKDSDSDEDAVLYADSSTGLVTLNGATATAEQATVSYASGVLTITVSSLATIEIAAGDYLLTVKSLDDGADTSHENNADLTVTRSGVGETSD